MKKNHQNHTSGTFWLYGRHSVVQALSNPDRIKIRLLLLSGTEKPLGLDKALPCEVVGKEVFAKYLPAGAVHQGIALEVKPLDNFDTEDIIRLTDSAQNGLILVLDEVTDVHNIGAILRSAAAFGATAVIVTDKNAPEENGTMARAASGALDIVPFIRVTNLVRTLERLKESGFWVIGMDGKADKSLSELDIPAKCVLILGSEGEGMRRLTLENCDFLAKLPINPQMESLNVSVAAGIALYALKNNKK